MKKVRECYTSISTGVDIVSPSASVRDVVAGVTRDPTSRSVFVVDPKAGLVGIIHVRELLLLYGARYLDDAGLASPMEIMARRAEHLMRPAYSVSPEDSLEKALKLAVQNELYDIPVVENGKVVGNLDCLEIITNCPPLD